MKLADLIRQETGVDSAHTMFLRHTTSSLLLLHQQGASVEEYTAIQPIGSRFDFLRDGTPPTSVVVVICNDAVYGVYIVDGVDVTGMTNEICTPEYRAFQRARGKPPRMCRKFRLLRLPSGSAGYTVSGWGGREIAAVQRGGDGFFDEIEVDASPHNTTKIVDDSAAQLQMDFARRVAAAAAASSEVRIARLAARPNRKPNTLRVLTTVFDRDPDVVAEALYRANGLCDECNKPAPFKRKHDGSPYLEVHHRKPLAEGGQDTIENAVALCPNCHRKLHHGA